MSSLKSNIFWNSVRVISNLLFPIITFPYVSRILGPESIGLFNYVTAIVGYFTLFASLGFPIYGTREIAVRRDNQQELNEVVNSIFSANTLSCIITVLAYIVYCLIFVKNNALLYGIVGFSILLNAISFEWFYQGVEDFRYITIRGIVIKCITVVCLFVFVRNESDLIAYAVLSVIGTCGNNILNVIRLNRYVKLCFTTKGIKEHVCGASVLFLGTITVSLYTSMNNILVGALCSMEDVGYFSTSNRLVQLVLSLIGAVTAAIIPRMSNLISTGNLEETAILQKKVLNLILYLTLPMTFGLYFAASPIIQIFAGDKFAQSIPAIKLLSFLIIIISLSSFLGHQILIPNKKEKYGNYCVITGAFTNIIFAFILTKYFSFIGIVLSMLLAETIITIMHLYFASKYTKLKVRDYFPIKACVATLIMVICLDTLLRSNPNIYLSILWIIIAAIIYIASLLILKDQFAKEIILKLLKK